MTRNPNNLVLVSTYGHLDSSRESPEIQGKTDQYIPAFVQYLGSNTQDIKSVVICGGLTRSDYPIEESVEILSYIYETKQLCDQIKNMEIYAETESVNMVEQLVFGILKVRVMLKDITKIIWICDKIRHQKAQKLIEALLQNTKFEFEVVSFDRPDINPGATPDKIFESIPPALENLKLLRTYFDLQINK